MSDLFQRAHFAGLSEIPVKDVASAKAHGLFAAWATAFRHILESHDVLEVESEFTFPLINPDTHGTSQTFLEAGKIDGVLRCRRTGVVKVLEHKTTSDSIDSDSNYWPRLVMDGQSSKYILALVNRGREVSTALYDVIRKPAFRLSNVPILDEDGVKIVEDSDGNRVRTKDGKKWRQTGDSELGYVVKSRPETFEELAYRTFKEVSENQADYFAQREIPRSERDLVEYMDDAWSLSQQILWYRRKGLWPRNPSACTAFSTCEFFDLCSGRAEVDGIRFAVSKSHKELTITDGDKQLLTNSRLSALRKCARYHFLRYEQPTERVGEQEEALALGSLFHQAADVFLRHFITK